MDYVYPVSTLLPFSTTYSSSAGAVTGPTFTFTNPPRSAVLELVVTQASTSNVTLDVYVQAACQDASSSGPIYDDFVHFNQVTTAGNQLAQWVREINPSTSSAGLVQALGIHTPATQTLAVGTVRQGPTGVTWRAQAVVGGGSSSQTAFKAQLVAHLLP